MTEHQTIHYQLASSVDLNQLVRDLADVDASTIVVAFDTSTGWDATDLELARLVAAARNNGKRLIAEHGANSTADRAVLTGFSDVAIVSDTPSTERSTSSFPVVGSEQPTHTIWTGRGNDDETNVINPPDKFSSTANLATYRPASEASTVSWVSAEGEADRPLERTVTPLGVTPISRSTIVHNKQNAPAIKQPLDRPLPQKDPVPLVAKEVGRGSDEIESEPDEVAPVFAPRSSRGRILKIAAAVIAPVLVLAVVGALAVYMLPTATVTLVPHEEPIASTLTYGVATANSSYDIEIEPSSLSSTSSAEATREATGERFEPVGNATGVVQITNPFTNEVTIPEGTELPGPNGVTYYTVEDVQLTAADPYGSMSFGSGNVSVYAGVIGPDGNIDAAALTGQLGNEMFYTNPEAISGGRMERHSVITTDDIAAAREQVTEELESVARDEFEAEVPDGYEIVPGSIEVGDPEIDVSPSEEQDGNEVVASGTISVTGEVYDPDELHQLASSEADRQLARHGGSERILLAETVDLHEPTALGDDEPGFEINVEAMARTVITETERQELIGQLVGLDREEAERILAQQSKVDRYEIEIEPDWLLNRMPEIASRISIRVSSGEQTASR
jgi:hypothetical protein